LVLTINELFARYIMKALKLISPLVALLLITVFFAGCATITVATNATTNSTLNSTVATNATTNGTLNGNATTASPTPSVSPSARVNSSANSTQKAATVGQGTNTTTNITASAAPSTVVTTEPFYINGTLTNSSSGAGIAYQTIGLYRSTGAAYVSTGVTTTTDANGSYTFTYSESTVGVYNYTANFAGFASYDANTSAPVTVNVANRMASKISISVTPASGNVVAGQQFEIYGSLTNGTGGIPDARVDLLYSMNLKNWSSASAPTKTGNGSSSGVYGFSGSVPAKGVYYFYVAYGGNVTYLGSNSHPLILTCTGPTSRQATTLYISVSNSTPIVNQQFFFLGWLQTATTAKTPLSAEPVWLQASMDQKTWVLGSSLAAQTVNGACAFNGNIGSAGTYYFRLYHPTTNSYLASYSNIITVKVKSPPATQATQLSIAANPATGLVAGQSVKLYGTLLTTGSLVPVAGGNVSLYWSATNAPGSYSLASSSYSVTNANGLYAFSGSLPSGTFYFKATYYAPPGSSKYLRSSSPVLTVKVS
jgi:hypothetical protein